MASKLNKSRRARKRSSIAKGTIPQKYYELPLRTYQSGGPQAANIDPMTAQWLTSLSTFPNDIHPGAGVFTYSQFRQMAATPYVASIIFTRMNQGSDFALPQPDPYSLGADVERTDGSPMLKKDRAVAGEIMEMYLNGGDRYFPGGSEAAIRALIAQTLTYDQANFEPLIDHATQKPYGWCPADAATIRRAAPTPKQLRDYRWDPDETAYVQVINNRVVKEFSRHEMSWCVRNRDASIYRYGYGAPELEKAITLITAIINAVIHNTVNYTTGIHSQNIIEAGILGNEERISTFERSVSSSMSGPRQSRRTPVIQTNPVLQEYIKVHPLGATNKDMEFSEWINFLKKSLCSLFQMDPAELGDIYGNEGQKQQMNQTSPSERIFASKERGLRPLMRQIARWLNDFLITPYWPGYKIVFKGFDAQSEERKLELDMKAVTGILTPDELRQERGRDPFGDPISQRPLNALWGPWTQQQLDAAQGLLDDPDFFL